MATITETGHAKNLANFDELVSFVSAYGTVYKPSKTSIALPELKKLSEEAKTAFANLNSLLPAYTNAVAARSIAFEPLAPLTTRVINAMRAIDTSAEVDASATTLIRKIQGRRASRKLTEEEKAERAKEGKEVVEISASQMSADNRLENLAKLIKLLKSIPQYIPNEPELSVAGLATLHQELSTKNAAVIAAATHVSNARILRNTIMYKPDTGLVDTAFAVKAYVKSLFGVTSPQNKQVSGMVFKNFKI